ncbi:hypothetical protein BU15DRAFT_60748 [Melanogaster broomeanus]|nr:hypothetical protein BU15DRAFT_60748 [Melanogaster broomeanus]
MVFVNNYLPEPEITEDELYGPEPYDFNFILPVPVLSTDKLRLVPFIPRVHAAAYLEAARGHETMYQYLPGALEYPSDFLRYLERSRRNNTTLIFAAIDLTRPDPKHPEWEGSLAGIFGLIRTEKARLVAEIGPAIVLPAFQRTHVKWAASLLNAASNKVATRMGFKLEGVSRWSCLLPKVEGYPRLGNEARLDDAGNGLLGADHNEWALCWDDWEGGGRELVQRVFARVA